MIDTSNFKPKAPENWTQVMIWFVMMLFGWNSLDGIRADNNGSIGNRVMAVEQNQATIATTLTGIRVSITEINTQLSEERRRDSCQWRTNDAFANALGISPSDLPCRLQ